MGDYPKALPHGESYTYIAAPYWESNINGITPHEVVYILALLHMESYINLKSYVTGDHRGGPPQDGRLPESCPPGGVVYIHGNFPWAVVYIYCNSAWGVVYTYGNSPWGVVRMHGNSPWAVVYKW